ncbi:c-type cytochrome [Chitinasiproducens palmae]|uniref:Cytochrome c553 n=1 Tax=Chitinasiproducens palmae TaxID=1770053 RepID=A0A1H2PUR2_9BURK|nr:c-type cytochrome [Chitinasiproducens palmae]SDV50946.1 Cytochrome c553 [Chitinasiproducens palmae]
MNKLLAAVALAVLGSVVTAPASAANAANGREIIERSNCAACHGPGLAKPVSGEYPKLAGQYADYTYFALRAYQVGNANPLFGRDNAVMRAQVQSLSESELRDIAAYIQSLPSDLVTKK